MRKLAIAAVLTLLAMPVAAQTTQGQVTAGQGKVKAEQLTEMTATVVSVNLETREVVLKNDKGEEHTIVAGPDIKRLAEVKAGDRVTLQYYESLTLALSKVEGGHPAAAAVATEERTAPTELPGGIKTQQTTIQAKVTAIDAKASTVTLVGPKGRAETLHVEPEILAKVRVGDMVSAVYTEAVAISLTRIQ